MRETLGWMGALERITGDPAKYYAAMCADPFHSRQKIDPATLERSIDLIVGVARRHEARLIVIFNPVPCGPFEADPALLAAVSAAHPDVTFLDDGRLRLWPNEKFVSWPHVAPERVAENSEWMGARLGALIRRLETYPFH